MYLVTPNRMPYTVRVDADERIGFVSLSGTVTGDDIISALEELYPDPAPEQPFDAVLDGRQIVKLFVGPEDTRTFLDYARARGEHVPTGRTAIIVRRSLDEMVARLFVELARFTRRERRIVSTVEEAEAWLGRKLALNRL